jgi:hypothetical protein
MTEILLLLLLLLLRCVTHGRGMGATCASRTSSGVLGPNRPAAARYNMSHNTLQ